MSTKNSFRPPRDGAGRHASGVNGAGLGAPGPQRIDLDPSTLPSLHCPKCASGLFHGAHQFLIVSALSSPTGRRQIVQVNTLLCVGCGSVWGSVQQLREIEAKDREKAFAVLRAMEEERIEGSADKGVDIEEKETNLKPEDLL